jgi:hypothetical protein
MFVLTSIFALRVAGQAVQLWYPQSWLPPLAEWQGSSLDYAILLPAQLAILAAMGWTSLRAWSGAWVPRMRAARGLALAGSVYMTAALGRLAIGMAMRSPPAWFAALIPGVFHVVLATFVLACAGCHASGQQRRAP